MRSHKPCVGSSLPEVPDRPWLFLYRVLQKFPPEVNELPFFSGSLLHPAAAHQVLDLLIQGASRGLTNAAKSVASTGDLQVGGVRATGASHAAQDGQHARPLPHQ